MLNEKLLGIQGDPTLGIILCLSGDESIQICWSFGNFPIFQNVYCLIRRLLSICFGFTYYFLQTRQQTLWCKTAILTLPRPTARGAGAQRPCLSSLSWNPRPDSGAQYILREILDLGQRLYFPSVNGRTMIYNKRHSKYWLLENLLWSKGNPGRCLSLLSSSFADRTMSPSICVPCLTWPQEGSASPLMIMNLTHFQIYKFAFFKSFLITLENFSKEYLFDYPFKLHLEAN